MNARYSYGVNALAGIVTLCTLAGCSSDLTGANRRAVQLSFTTRAAGAASPGVAVSGAAQNGDLVVTRVQMVIDDIELGENDDVDCVAEIESEDGGHDEMEEECEDVSRDPLLVDIPVDDAAHAVITVPLAEGTFRKVEAKLEPSRVAAFNALHPNVAGQSVRVEGTFKGNSFVFTSAVRASLEMEFDPPLVIDASTKNATISLDVARWFIDRNGAVIDPGSAAPGSNALQQIEDNIRRSFHAFEDDDESGMDDHDEHRG